LVAIKVTIAYRDSEDEYQDIDKGRAGRVGFDTFGTTVTMTDAQSEQKYMDIRSSLEDVESQLKQKVVQLQQSLRKLSRRTNLLRIGWLRSFSNGLRET
jgi:replicative superfamily II helicase